MATLKELTDALNSHLLAYFKDKDATDKEVKNLTDLIVKLAERVTVLEKARQKQIKLNEELLTEKSPDKDWAIFKLFKR